MADWFMTSDGDYLNLDRGKLVKPVGLGTMRLFFEWGDSTGFNQDCDVKEPDAGRLREHLNAASGIHKYGVVLGLDETWMERAQTLANRLTDSSVIALMNDLLKDAWRESDDATP